MSKEKIPIEKSLVDRIKLLARDRGVSYEEYLQNLLHYSLEMSRDRDEDKSFQELLGELRTQRNDQTNSSD